MLSISATDAWRAAYPGAAIGLLELSQITQAAAASLDQQKRKTEERMRRRYEGFTRQAFLSLPIMSAYDKYYRRFGKTYHVLQQVESIVLKGKNLPNVNPAVDANFIAEVDTLVLTAGHDVARLQEPIRMDIAREGDGLVQMNGTEKKLLAGDMVMRDSQGVCCAIIYGQDNISPILLETTHVLYVSYAPAGVPIEQVNSQLTMIKENILTFSPATVVEQQKILAA